MEWNESKRWPDLSAEKVSVVIPHKGDNTQLWRCLIGLERQTMPKDLFEVIVVFNRQEVEPIGSDFDLNLTFVSNNEGFSYAARNVGLKLARHEIIAFTDSDAIPCPGWLETGRRLFERDVHMVSGSVVMVAQEATPRWVRDYESAFAFDQEWNFKNGRSVTANLFVRLSLFAEIGFFDDGSRSGEDFRWTKSATTSNFRLVYAPKAQVFHPFRRSLLSLFHKAVRVGQSESNLVSGRRGRFKLRIQRGKRRGQVGAAKFARALTIFLAVELMKRFSFVGFQIRRLKGLVPQLASSNS